MKVYIVYANQTLEQAMLNDGNLLGEIGLKFWPDTGFHVFEELMIRKSDLIMDERTYVIDEKGKKYTVDKFLDNILDKEKNNGDFHKGILKKSSR